MSRGPDVTTLLERRLRIAAEAAGVAIEIVASTATPWASATFNGARHHLTLIGDGFRLMRPTVWIDKLFRSAPGQRVVTDMRYLNEVQSIRDRGGVVILLYRPGFANDLPTPSEQELVPLVQQLLDWSQMIALWGSLGALLVGAALYGLAREGGSYSNASRGKGLAIGGVVGAILAGIAPTAVNLLFKAASS